MSNISIQIPEHRFATAGVKHHICYLIRGAHTGDEFEIMVNPPTDVICESHRVNIESDDAIVELNFFCTFRHPGTYEITVQKTDDVLVSEAALFQVMPSAAIVDDSVSAEGHDAPEQTTTTEKKVQNEPVLNQTPTEKTEDKKVSQEDKPNPWKRSLLYFVGCMIAIALMLLFTKNPTEENRVPQKPDATDTPARQADTEAPPPEPVDANTQSEDAKACAEQQDVAIAPEITTPHTGNVSPSPDDEETKSAEEPKKKKYKIPSL